mgnify:CR=1 FL=1
MSGANAAKQPVSKTAAKTKPSQKHNKSTSNKNQPSSKKKHVKKAAPKKASVEKNHQRKNPAGYHHLWLQSSRRKTQHSSHRHDLRRMHQDTHQSTHSPRRLHRRYSLPQVWSRRSPHRLRKNQQSESGRNHQHRRIQSSSSKTNSCTYSSEASIKVSNQVTLTINTMASLAI